MSKGLMIAIGGQNVCITPPKIEAHIMNIIMNPSPESEETIYRGTKTEIVENGNGIAYDKQAVINFTELLDEEAEMSLGEEFMSFEAYKAEYNMLRHEVDKARLIVEASTIDLMKNEERLIKEIKKQNQDWIKLGKMFGYRPSFLKNWYKNHKNKHF